MKHVNMRGTPKDLEFIKYCVFTLTCWTAVTSKYCPFDVMHLWRLFSTAQNSFWTHSFWCLLVLPFFISPLPHQQNVSLWGLISSRETNKQNHSCWDWVNREGGAWGHAAFGQKVLNTQHVVGSCACKSPIMKWANAFKESSKIIHWGRVQPLTTMASGTLIQMGS